MTLKLFLTFGFIHSALCATYSNVLVRSGSEVVPLEYINYGGPVAYARAAQISAAPIDSVVPLPNARQCVGPCVIANAPISGLAPIPATVNAQIVAYPSPVANVPIVLANTDDASYQYAYAVYDEGTGDKKTQSEQSDGSLVQGQYSFIQPDGYRREVIYTADDLKGFNAIVKTVAPEPEPAKIETSEESKESKDSPCNEPKKEQLVEAPKSDEKPTESSEEVTEQVENTEPVSTDDTKNEEKSINETPAPSTEAIKPDIETNSVIAYSDIIDCLQSKRIASAKSISPLTYVLIPSLNNVQRPC